jgi:hypothetical protein
VKKFLICNKRIADWNGKKISKFAIFGFNHKKYCGFVICGPAAGIPKKFADL